MQLGQQYADQAQRGKDSAHGADDHPTALQHDPQGQHVGLSALEGRAAQRTHTKVFTVVCSLVNGSSDIATFANTLSGAQQLIQLVSAFATVSSSQHKYVDIDMWVS